MLDKKTSLILRYAACQLPGALVLALALFAANRLFIIPGWVSPAIAGGWLVLNIAMFPLVKRAYAPKTDEDMGLIGAMGVACETLSPSGYVKVGGELWRACTAENGEVIPKGSPVLVKKRRGLTLIVSRRGND